MIFVESRVSYNLKIEHMFHFNSQAGSLPSCVHIKAVEIINVGKMLVYLYKWWKGTTLSIPEMIYLEIGNVVWFVKGTHPNSQ